MKIVKFMVLIEKKKICKIIKLFINLFILTLIRNLNFQPQKNKTVPPCSHFDSLQMTRVERGRI